MERAFRSALISALASLDFMSGEERIHSISGKLRTERKPSGKNRDKAKAARKQRRASKGGAG